MARRQRFLGGPRSQGRPGRFGGPGRPPVPWAAVRGEWYVSQDLAWPAIVWRGGQAWGYLHDFEPRAVQLVLNALREAELARSRPHGLLVW